MASERVKLDDAGAGRPTRRQILRASAAVALGVLGSSVTGAGPHLILPAASTQPTSQPTSVPTSGPATRPAHPTPWWLGEAYPRSVIVEVRSPYVLRGADVDTVALDEMLAMGVQVLTGTRTLKEAWLSILGPAKRIVLKFNRVGASILDTNDAMARALVGSLQEGGYDTSLVAVVEIPPQLVGELGARTPASGWGPPITLGDASEEVANYLYEADAVISASLLKTHQIAGVSGAMKNLSHALIQHPARFHASGCSPYVGQVIANKEVSSRLKLNIVSTLRAVVRNGPEARREDVVTYGGLLLGFDPVAVDATGWDILRALRQRLGIEEGLEVPYLVDAAAAGVGRLAQHELELIPIRHGS